MSWTFSLGKKCSTRKNSQCLEIQRRSPEDRVSFPKWTFLQFCKASCLASISSRFSVEHNLRRLPLKYLISQKIEIRSYAMMSRSPPFLSSARIELVIKSFPHIWRGGIFQEDDALGPSLRLRSNHYSTLWECVKQKLAHFVKVDWWDGSHILTSLFLTSAHWPQKSTIFITVLHLTKWDFFGCFLNTVSEKLEAIIGFPRFLFTFLKGPPLIQGGAPREPFLFFFSKKGWIRISLLTATHGKVRPSRSLAIQHHNRSLRSKTTLQA